MADFGNQSDTLDPGQIERAVYDKAKIAKRVVAYDALVPEDYDAWEVAYVASGPGKGDVGMITFKKEGNIVAALAFDYDSDNKLTSVARV